MSERMVSEDGNPDGTRDRLGWYPTPAQFDAYLVREVEMAKANLAKGHTPDTSLHSARTMTQALQERKLTGDKA